MAIELCFIPGGNTVDSVQILDSHQGRDPIFCLMVEKHVFLFRLAICRLSNKDTEISLGNKMIILKKWLSVEILTITH
jgi:hypothetical protein